MEAPAPPVQREATGRAPASAPAARGPRAPRSPSACQCAARLPASRSRPRRPARPRHRSRLSDGTHADPRLRPPRSPPRAAAPARPLPVLPVARQRQDAAPASPDAAPSSLATGPQRRAPCRPRSRLPPTVSRSSGPSCPPSAPGRCPGRGRNVTPGPAARRRPPAVHPPPARTPRRRGPSSHAGTPATRLPSTVTSDSRVHSLGARSARPAVAGRAPAPRPAAMPQAANGAREIVFPPRDAGARGPPMVVGRLPRGAGAGPGATVRAVPGQRR